MLRFTIPCLFAIALGCSGKPEQPSLPTVPAPADPEAAGEIRRLIPKAASMPSDLAQILGMAGQMTTHAEARKRGSLTYAALILRPYPGIDWGDDFRYFQPIPNRAQIAAACTGEDPTYVSLIQPQYITDITCVIEGQAAIGTVSFEAPKVYKGKVEYTATKADNVWKVIAFHWPKIGLTLTLQPDGFWKTTKIPPPAPKMDESLAADVTALQGTWERSGDLAGTSMLATVAGNKMTVSWPSPTVKGGIAKTTAEFALQKRGEMIVILFYNVVRQWDDPKDPDFEADEGRYEWSSKRDGNRWIIGKLGDEMLRHFPGEWKRP